MFLKLGIICAILILGGLVFSSEINELFPSTSGSIVESLNEDISGIGTTVTESVEKRLDTSIDKIVEKTSEQINTEINDVKEFSNNILSDELEKLNSLGAIVDLFSNKPQESNEVSKTSFNDSSTKENSP